MTEIPDSSIVDWWTLGSEAALQQFRKQAEENSRERREGRKRGWLTSSLVERLRSCNPEQLRAVRKKCQEFLNDHRTAPSEYDCGQRYRRTVLVSIPAGNKRYQLEKRPCGKGCKQCPHGPYLYAYFRDGSIIKQKYLGKGPYRAIPRKVRGALRALEVAQGDPA